MDWLTFLSSDVKSLAWPVAVVVAVVVVKRDLAALLRTLAPRLQKAKGPWGELTFGQGVDEVEDKLPAEDAKAITKPEDAERIDNVAELVRLPPPYIVSQAWLRLEKTIQNAADNSPASSAAPSPRKGYLNIRAARRILSEDEIEVFNELRQLRNRAAHSLDSDITITDALRYNDIANSLIQKIERYCEGKALS